MDLAVAVEDEAVFVVAVLPVVVSVTLALVGRVEEPEEVVAVSAAWAADCEETTSRALHQLICWLEAATRLGSPGQLL